MNMKSLAGMLILILVLPLPSISQSRSESDSLTLTIKLQSAYNPGVRLCTPIVINDAHEFVWSRDIVRSSISALLTKSEGGVYQLKFELKEGAADTVAYDLKVEPSLELENPYKLTFTKYSGFEFGYNHTLLLSKEGCK